MTLRRSQRTKRSTIYDDYKVYLQEHDFDISDDLDLVTYEEAKILKFLVRCNGR